MLYSISVMRRWFWISWHTCIHAFAPSCICFLQMENADKSCLTLIGQCCKRVLQLGLTYHVVLSFCYDLQSKTLRDTKTPPQNLQDILIFVEQSSPETRERERKMKSVHFKLEIIWLYFYSFNLNLMIDSHLLLLFHDDKYQVKMGKTDGDSYVWFIKSFGNRRASKRFNFEWF